MKSFKEFLMENEEGQDNDVQNLKILNDLKDFFNNFNAAEKDKDINQEIITKYLICKSIIKTNKGEDIFGLKLEDSNKYLQELKKECRKLLTINSEASANSDLAKKIKSINEYILEKYKKQKLGSLLLNKGDIKIDQDMSFANFISEAEEKINLLQKMTLFHLMFLIHIMIPKKMVAMVAIHLLQMMTMAIIVAIAATVAITKIMAPLDKAHILDVLLLLKWKILCLEMKIK